MRKNQIMGFVFASILYYLASAYIMGGAAGAGRDDWLCLTAGSFAALPAVLLTAFLSQKCGGRPFGEWIKTILPRFQAALLSGFFMLYGVMLLSFSLDCFSRYLCIAVLPETPKWVLTLLLTACVYPIARSGAEGMRRLSGFLFPAVIFTILAVLALSVKVLELSRLLPVGRQISAAAIVRDYGFPHAEPVLLLALASGCGGAVKKRHFLLPFGLSALLLIVTCARNTAVLGGALAGLFSFPTVQADSVIGYGSIGQRIEVLSTLIPASAAFLETGIAARFALDAAQGIGGKGKEKYLLPGVLLAGFLLCVFVYRTDAALQLRIRIWPYISASALIPAAILLLRFQKKTREKGKRFLRCLKKTMK